MKNFLKKFHMGQKGFTLIELLVVIAILGVLAAVVIPNVASFIGRGEEEAKKTELHNVITAVTAALAESDDGTVATYDDATITGDATALANDPAKYLVPGQTTAYLYDITADGTVTQGAKAP